MLLKCIYRLAKQRSRRSSTKSTHARFNLKVHHLALLWSIRDTTRHFSSQKRTEQIKWDLRQNLWVNIGSWMGLERLTPRLLFAFTQTRGLIAAPGPWLAFLCVPSVQPFWEYQSPAWAGRFLDEWCSRVMRSRLEPLKKVARSLRSHRELLLNWFRAKGTISAGIVEGFNNKAKLTMRKSYGFREYETIELALYHQLGDLPQPELTHRFC